MRQAEKERKKFQSQIPLILDPGKKIPKKIAKKLKKIKKPLSGIIFSQNGIRQVEKEKKYLVPNSIHTRPGQENSKKNSKKIQKPLSGIIFSQNEIRQAEKERKKFHSQIPLILNLGKKIQKRNSKKIKKPFSGIIFSQNGDEIGREIGEKNLVLNSVHT